MVRQGALLQIVLNRLRRQALLKKCSPIPLPSDCMAKGDSNTVVPCSYLYDGDSTLCLCGLQAILFFGSSFISVRSSNDVDHKPNRKDRWS